MTRRWAGLSEDGSDGTPLLEELEKRKSDLSDISSDEMLSPGQELPDMSPISSEDEMEVDISIKRTSNTTNESSIFGKSSSSDLVKDKSVKTGEAVVGAQSA